MIEMDPPRVKSRVISSVQLSGDTMILFFRARQLPKGQGSFSVQLNSYVLRSIDTAPLYYRAYNGSDPAVLHYAVRTTTVRSGTSTASPLCL